MPSADRLYFRCVALIIDREQVLLHRVGSARYWSLPGGKVELGESSNAALEREIREELGIESEINRLVWVVENFFSHGTTRIHELGMYYLVSPRDCSLLRNRGDEFASVDGGTPLYFKWFDLEAVRSMDLFPVFLRQQLMDIPSETRHLIIRDQA